MSAVLEVKQYYQALSYALSAIEEHEVWRTGELLREVREKQGMVWLVGNGGSAATASHFANDLWKACHIKAIALPDLVPVITAFGNDDGWDRMFSQAMQGMMRQDDVLLAISCSGASGNVLTASSKVDKERLVIMTGLTHWQNELAKFPCYAKLLVPSNDIRIVEDAHLAICHSLVGILREQ